MLFTISLKVFPQEDSNKDTFSPYRFEGKPLNPLTFKISLVILLTVFCTILTILVQRIWYPILSNIPLMDIFRYSHPLSA